MSTTALSATAAMQTRLILMTIAVAAMLATASADSGYATYSNIGSGVCPGGSSNGLPGVSMNAAQFGGGDACGKCIQVQGSGTGAGKTPVSTAPFMAVVTNVCSSCGYGDIDLQESGDGKFAVSWSYVSCPGGRKLIEGDSAANDDSAVADAAAPEASTVQDSTPSQEEAEAEAASPTAAVAEAEGTPDAASNLLEEAISEAAAPDEAATPTEDAVTSTDSIHPATAASTAASARPITARRLLRSL